MRNDATFGMMAWSVIALIFWFGVSHVRESDCQMIYDVSDCTFISVPHSMAQEILTERRELLKEIRSN